MDYHTYYLFYLPLSIEVNTWIFVHTRKRT